jgi:hypothetical protein
MSFPGFNDPWYAEIIERFRHNTEEAPSINPALDGLGVAILASACIIAQSLDELTKALKEKNT